MANRHFFDKTFVEDTVRDSNRQLAELIVVVASDIKQEMRDQSVIAALQELQANIAVLGQLLDLANTSELKSSNCRAIDTSCAYSPANKP